MLSYHKGQLHQYNSKKAKMNVNEAQVSLSTIHNESESSLAVDPCFSCHFSTLLTRTKILIKKQSKSIWISRHTKSKLFKSTKKGV